MTTKKMFGGYGVFEDGVMFALIDSVGKAFLRADESTSAKYAEAASEPHHRMPYWRIPDEVRKDPRRLIEWATEARDRARALKK